MLMYIRVGFIRICHGSSVIIRLTRGKKIYEYEMKLFRRDARKKKKLISSLCFFILSYFRTTRDDNTKIMRFRDLSDFDEEV